MKIVVIDIKTPHTTAVLSQVVSGQSSTVVKVQDPYMSVSKQDSLAF